jgi:GT2 family glycosyltransferase
MDKNPQVGQLATMIVDGFSPDILLDCGIHRCGPLFGGRYHRAKMSDTHNKHLEQRRVLGACTAGSVVRRDVLNVVGKFDESYYYPCEDLDLSLRIHLAGYDVIYEPSFVVYHYEAQAMGERQELKKYLYRRNCLLALWENYPLTIAATTSISLFRKIFFKFLTFRKDKSVDAEFEPTTEARYYTKIFLYLALNSLKITVKRLRINKFRSRQRKYLLEVN